MPQLIQGRIIRAEVVDPAGGNPKTRPLVIVTATSEINSSDPFVAIGITGSITGAPDEVALPWHSTVRTTTQLKKPCVALCSWRCTIEHANVKCVKGVVPPAEMRQILEQIELQRKKT